MLDEDIQDATDDLEKNIEGFRELPVTVQEALVNMCFNMGISRLMQFKKTLALIQEGKFVKAGNEALNSKWASQVGYRSVEVAALIKEGSECSKI
jgi:lysozyme